MSELTKAMIDAAMVAFGDTELVGYDFTRRAVTGAVEAALADMRRAAPTDDVCADLAPEWQEKLNELYAWTGSKYVEKKPELYGFLCSLIGWMIHGGQQASLFTPEPVKAAPTDAVERAYRSGWRNAMLLKDEPRANEDAGWGIFRAALAAMSVQSDKGEG